MNGDGPGGVVEGMSFAIVRGWRCSLAGMY